VRKREATLFWAMGPKTQSNQRESRERQISLLDQRESKDGY